MKNDLKFIAYFYGIFPRKNDILRYNLYFKAQREYKIEGSFKKISDLLMLSKIGKSPKCADYKSDYKQEALIKQGREQFEKLVKRGLAMPITLL